MSKESDDDDAGKATAGCFLVIGFAFVFLAIGLSPLGWWVACLAAGVSIITMVILFGPGK